MGIEPHRITSSIWGVIAQRLLRKRDADGYRGRVPVAELLTLDRSIRDAILARADASTIQSLALKQPNYLTMAAAARKLIEQQITDDAEVLRALGEQLK